MEIRSLKFPVGGTSALYDAEGRMIERGTADDVVHLHVPTAEDMAPIREVMAEGLDVDAYRNEGRVEFTDPQALVVAMDAVRDIMFSGMGDDTRIFFDACVTDEQLKRLDDIVLRIVGLPATLKALAEDVPRETDDAHASHGQRGLSRVVCTGAGMACR